MARRSASIGLLVALFVLPLYPKIPLVGVSGTYIPVRFDDLIIAIAAAIWVIALVATRRLPQAPRELTAAVTLWLGVTLIAFVVGAFFLDSIGILTGAAYWAKPIEYLLLGLMAYDMVRNGWVPVRYLVATILGSAAIVIGYGSAEHFGIVPHLAGQTPPPGGTISTIGDFHELASYLGLIIILAVCLVPHAPSRRTRWALAAFIGAAIFVLFWSGTRSEYIALFLVLIGLAVWRPTRAPAAVAAVAMVFVFLSPILVFLAAYMTSPPGQTGYTPGTIPPGPFYSVTVRFSGESLAYSLSERFLQKWPALFQATMRSPIIGLGPSAAGEAADGYYLRSFVESGIVGLIAFITLVVTIFVSAVRAVRVSSGTARSLAMASIGATVFVVLVGVLIDTWVASRVMDLYWPLVGLALGAVALQTDHGDVPSPISSTEPVSAASGA